MTGALVRERFGGRVTCAAVPLERVEWAPFDIVSLDLYRSAEIADQFAEGVRHLVAQGKPVAISEFGAAGCRGAGDRGASIDVPPGDRRLTALVTKLRNWADEPGLGAGSPVDVTDTRRRRAADALERRQKAA